MNIILCIPGSLFNVDYTGKQMVLNIVLLHQLPEYISNRWIDRIQPSIEAL